MEISYSIPYINASLTPEMRRCLSEADAHRRDEVGGGGGHSGARGRARAPQGFGQEGPHHSITGEQQTSTQQSERNVQLSRGKWKTLVTTAIFSSHKYLMGFTNASGRAMARERARR